MIGHMSRRTEIKARLEANTDRTPRQERLLTQIRDDDAASARTDELDRQARAGDEN